MASVSASLKPDVRRAGATVGDMLIILGALSLAGALVRPAWVARESGALVEAAVSDVSSVVTMSRTVRERTNRWPTSAPPGQAPPELPGLGGPSGPFARSGYRLGWTDLDVVDSVDAPPAPTTSRDDAPTQSGAAVKIPVVRRLGAVTVYSSDEALLAELLERYPEGSALVVDTVWVLVLPERGEGPGR